MKSPTVCIDCSPLLVRSAGVKTYLFHLLRELRRVDPEHVKTFLAPRDLGRLEHDGGPRLHPAKIAALFLVNLLPRFIADAAVPSSDVFHVSNQIRKVPRRHAVTTTLHDLTAWIVPECHTQANVAADHAFAERVLRRAAGIIAVSENTRQDAIRILGLAPERIHVIHLGVPKEYFDVHSEAVTRAVLMYGLLKPYFLFVGTIEPRKNVDTLLSAWESMPPETRQQNDLVIAGMPGWRADATMKRLSHMSAESASVRFLGYVPEANLPGLTAGARAFVYPSLYEGFGIPVAQAMAAGCAVITANVSSLPEITDGAALLVDPRSPRALAAAMQRLAESDDVRRQLISQATEKASRFSWETAAAKSLKFFETVAGS